jgi:uncharacterized protein YndB with AHSA1/START domain
MIADASGGRRTDSATRVIAASPQAIYQAFLDPEAWVKWLPPEGMTGQIYEFEPRPGGVYRMALTYSKGDRQPRGKTAENTDVVEGVFWNWSLTSRSAISSRSNPTIQPLRAR